MTQQKIVFTDHLFASMETGEKRFTIRRGTRDYVLGEVLFSVADDPWLNFNARIVSLKTTTINELRSSECEIYGYQDRLDVLQVISGYYEGLTIHDTITIVEFKID